MGPGTIHVVAQIGSVSIDATVSRDYEGEVVNQGTLPAGKAGTLGTRTDNDTGVVNLSAGHGLQNGDKVDVFWSGGSRFGMGATVSSNDVTIDAGGGDNLPLATTAVVVTKRVPIDMAFSGDKLKMLAACCKTNRIRVSFETAAGASLYSRDLPAGEPLTWVSDQGITNPLAGGAVGCVQATNGQADAAATIAVGAKIDSM